MNSKKQEQRFFHKRSFFSFSLLLFSLSIFHAQNRYTVFQINLMQPMNID